MSKIYYRSRVLEYRNSANQLIAAEDNYADFEDLEAAKRWHEFTIAQPNVAAAEIIEIYR